MTGIRLLVVVGVVLGLAVQGMGQNQHANQSRGFDANGVYANGEIDSVNVFNGGLVLNIPIGQRYKVGNLSYGLNLVYNSNLWTHKEVCTEEIVTSGAVYGTWVYTAPPDSTAGSFVVYDRFVPNQTDPISRPRGDGCWTVAIPNPSTNVGMGWQIMLGKLFPPRSSDQDMMNPHPLKTENVQWVYETPDGSEHAFYPTLHATDPPGNPNISYTRDGSYLRMRHINNQRLIEFPDGTVHVFSNSNSGDINYWRLTQIHDQFTDAHGQFVNKVDIEYVKDASGKEVLWKLRDSYGREQRITFEVKADQYQPVITKVELTAFGSGAATYLFNYEVRSVKRAAPHTPDGVHGATVTVPFLNRITLPDLSAYSLSPIDTSYALSDETIYARQRGVIRGLTLPTGGRLEWDWRLYQFSYLSSGRGYQDISLGVNKRRVIEGTRRREWLYEPLLEARPLNSNEGKSCLIDTESIKPECGSKEFVTRVTTPHGDYTKYYFSVYAHPWDGRRTLGRNIHDWHIAEYGLPVTKYQSTNDSTGQPLFLSQQIFRSGANENDPLRSVYVRYETDTIPLENGFGSSVKDINRRVAATRTVFHDDDNNGEKFSEVVHSDFDGLGHYRTTSSYGNFVDGTGTAAQRGAVGDLRLDVRKYNPTRGTYVVDAATNTANGSSFTNIPEQDLWILGTYDMTISGDYNKRSSNYFYFDRKGLLRRKRIGSTLELANNKYFVRSHDVLVAYDYAPDGTLATESYYGGDLENNLPNTWPLDQVQLPASPEYRINHDYDFGVLRTSQYAGASFRTVENTIDPNTGLVQSSLDMSQNKTDYQYDQMGRLTHIVPRQGSRTEIVYTHFGQAIPGGTADRPSINVYHFNPQGTVIDDESYQYDVLGRLTTESKRMPGGVISRTTKYNDMGWKESISEWGGAADTGVKKTTYGGYDPFGRPGIITPPDTPDHKVFVTYIGMREVRRTVKIATGRFLGAVMETDSRTTEFYDRQGRLSSVVEPSGPGGANVTTYYNYDVGNKLIKVRTSASPVAGAAQVTQARDLEFDNRGFLLWEKLPEVGAGGNGTIAYGNYDTMGNVGTRVDGTRSLRFTYDFAGRTTLVEDKNSAGAYRPLKEFTFYATNNISTGNYRLGQLHEATRHNYVNHPASGTEIDVQVKETYLYKGLDGRISDRTTLLNSSNAQPLIFNQSFDYDLLGHLSSQTYPQCVNATCVSSGMAVPRTVDYIRSKGIPTKVASGAINYATSLTYHSNGMLNAITYGNGVVLTHGKDPNGMQRVASFTTTGVAGTNTNWSSGPYSYDGTGNIMKVGADWYFYDKVGRIVEGTALSGSNRKQTYTYDTFGNLRSIDTYQNATTNPTLESANNLDVNANTNRVNGVSYDASGNMLGLPAENPKPYSYDALNRQKTAPGKTFIYTASDERVWIIDHSAPTWVETYTLRGLNNEVLREYQVLNGDAVGHWQWSKDYIYADGKLLASEAPSGRLFYHLDHLGTPRLITNASAQRVSSHQYFPFGFEATWSGQSAERLRFTGHERDTHVNGHTLDHMHARVYNPYLGRFLSVDPGRDVDAKTPQSWNMYAYTRNNPQTYVDPDGAAIILSSQGNPEYMRDLLIQTVMRESGRNLWTTIAHDPNFIVVLAEGPLNRGFGEVSPLTLGEGPGLEKNDRHMCDPVGVVLQLDSSKRAENLLDTTGLVTFGHESWHMFGFYMKDPDPDMANIDHLPIIVVEKTRRSITTMAGGPAAQYGLKLLFEKPDKTREEATAIVDSWLKLGAQMCRSVEW